MLFPVGANVWFKAAGSTPFVTGSATDPTAVVGNNLNGLGDPTISTTPGSLGLGNEQGVPELDVAGFPTPLTVEKTVQVNTVADAPGALAGAEGSAGNVEVGDHSYVVTFVTPDGETEGGTVSATVTVTVSAKEVDLTSIPVSPDPAVTARRIYRTIAGDTGDHLLAVTISNNVDTTGTDDTADGSLGVAVPAANTTGSFDTFPSTGATIGVKEQGVQNPLAPGTVGTTGKFDDPTAVALFPDQFDEGRVDSKDNVNTIRTIDPNQGSGRSASSGAAVAEGTSIPLEGSQEFVKEIIDVKNNTVGLRTPSSEEAPGTIIEIVQVTATKSISPDGTNLKSGDFLYWVNWGSSAASKPYRTKRNNRHRVQLHAEADLIAA